MVKRSWLVALSVLVFGCGGGSHPNPPVPPGYILNIVVKDAGLNPSSAMATWDGTTPGSIYVVNSASVWFDHAGFNVCVARDGYSSSSCLPVGVPTTQTLTFTITELPPPPPVVPVGPTIKWPPDQPRSALPPFPALTSSQPPNAGVWSNEAYVQDPGFTPPNHPDIDFHRGNFSGVRIPGLPWLGFGTDKDPTHVMSWDLPRFPVDLQKLVLQGYADRGYTHFLISIPQARNAGVLDQRFLDAAVLAKSYGQFVVVVAFGGDGESWEADVQPWLDKLVALHAVDEVNTVWQGDKWYGPYELVSLTKQVGEWAHPRGVKVSQHWINGALAYWNPEDENSWRTADNSTCVRWQICDRFSYHRVIAQWVDYQYFQGDTEAPIGDFQWSLGKVLQSFTTEKLVISEDDAQAEFDDPLHRTEDQGDLKGYLLLGASWMNGKVMDGGYMNGARRPDGRVF